MHEHMRIKNKKTGQILTITSSDGKKYIVEEKGKEPIGIYAGSLRKTIIKWVKK